MTPRPPAAVVRALRGRYGVSAGGGGNTIAMTTTPQSPENAGDQPDIAEATPTTPTPDAQDKPAHVQEDNDPDVQVARGDDAEGAVGQG